MVQQFSHQIRLAFTACMLLLMQLASGSCLADTIEDGCRITQPAICEHLGHCCESLVGSESNVSDSIASHDDCNCCRTGSNDTFQPLGHIQQHRPQFVVLYVSAVWAIPPWFNKSDGPLQRLSRGDTKSAIARIMPLRI